MANLYIVSCIFKGCNIYQAVLKIYSQVNKCFWSYVKIVHVCLFMLRYKSLKFYFLGFTFLLTSAPISMNFVYAEGFFPLLRTFSAFEKLPQLRNFSVVEKLFHTWETFASLRKFSFFMFKGSKHEKLSHAWGAFPNLRDLFLGFIFVCASAPG